MTFTHLRVGTSKLPSKPPRAQPPCLEPYVTGANILRDPGFELQASNTGVGPYGDQIPETVGTFPAEWWKVGGNEPVADRNPAWVCDKGDYLTPRRWYLSTTNPRSGTYHARMEGKASVKDGGTSYGDNLYPMRFIWCDNATSDWWWAGRAAAGDYVRLGAWADSSTVVGGPGLWIDLRVYGPGPGFNLLAESSARHVLTTSYAWYEQDLFVPAGGYYVFAAFSVNSSVWAAIPTDITVDVDDCVLEVS